MTTDQHLIADRGAGTINAGDTLHVRLLGGFELTHGGHLLVGFAQARLQCLLAYLLLHRDAPISRQQLAFSFWPDTTDEQARSNLRTLLHRLLETLPDSQVVLAVDRHVVRWRDDAPVTLDVTEFEAALACARQAEQSGDRAEARRWLEKALDIYAGELVPGCYDDWIIPIRERLSQTALQATEQLVLLLEADGDWHTALTYAQRLLRSDPLQEATYRHLMRLHAFTGDRTGVVRVFNACASVLRRELDVTPDAETRAAYRAALAQAATHAGTAHLMPTGDSSPRGSLPPELTKLIGRERDLAAVRGLLRDKRLVTLTGSAGVGKSRLALRVASELQGEFSDGAWWVDLESVADAAMVTPTIASALGMREGGGLTPTQALAGRLAGRRLLLVLRNNCEHQAGQVGRLIQTLLRSAPRVRILATSQRSLGIPGEAAWRVPSLALPPPPPTQIAGAEIIPEDQVRELSQCASVQLFAERAQGGLPTFALTTGNAAAVAQICRRLNGIPLAIELAASRIRALSPDQIAGRLDSAFSLLARETTAEPTRQQTLWAAMEWSHGLLTQSERILLRRLAAFAGSFTLDAAEAVCAGHGLATERVLELLAGLEDKSLVEADPSHGPPRFRLHEMIRQYATVKLAEASEAARVQGRHLDRYAGLVAAAEPHLTGERQAEWLDHLEAEHDNLVAALAWSLSENACSEIGLQMAGGLVRFWTTRGHFSEGRRWAGALLAASDPPIPTPGRLKALRAAAMLAHYQSDYAEAHALYEQALAAAQTLGDRHAIAVIRRGQGIEAHGQGDYPTALRRYEESLALCREIGDRQGEATALANLGLALWQQGDAAAGRRHLEACLALRRELRDETGIAYALHVLADIAWSKGQHHEAQSLNDESLRMRRRVGDKWGIAYSLDSLGAIVRRQGDGARARALFAESLMLFNALGSQRGLSDVLDHLAGLLADEGNHAAAAQLMAAAASLRETARAVLPPNARADHERQLACLRTQLGDERFRAAWTLGQAMTTERAVRYALELTAL